MRPHVINHGDVIVDPRFPERNPANRMYGYRILAEGDSWFTLGAVPSSNILFNLRVSKPTALVTIAFPGDTIIHMGDPGHMLQLRRFLADTRFAYEWDALLLSGGGNDMIDVADELLPNCGVATTNAADYVDADRLRALIVEIQTGYANIVSVRDQTGSPNKGVPIYVHTYDYPTPRPSPTRFLGAGIKGPWLDPAFTGAGIPSAMWRPVCDYLLDQISEAILALDSARQPAPSAPRPLDHFHVVDTRNTLTRAAAGEVGTSGDWTNEIHPTTAGYTKLAEKISARMNL